MDSPEDLRQAAAASLAAGEGPTQPSSRAWPATAGTGPALTTATASLVPLTTRLNSPGQCLQAQARPWAAERPPSPRGPPAMRVASRGSGPSGAPQSGAGLGLLGGLFTGREWAWQVWPPSCASLPVLLRRVGLGPPWGPVEGQQRSDQSAIGQFRPPAPFGNGTPGSRVCQMGPALCDLRFPPAAPGAQPPRPGEAGSGAGVTQQGSPAVRGG